MNEEETRQKIIEFIRMHKITEDDFDGEMIFGWCRQYDTHIDNTNISQFIIDRFDKPLLYLQTFLSNDKPPPKLVGFSGVNVKIT